MSTRGSYRTVRSPPTLEEANASAINRKIRRNTRGIQDDVKDDQKTAWKHDVRILSPRTPSPPPWTGPERSDLQSPPQPKKALIPSRRQQQSDLEQERLIREQYDHNSDNTRDKIMSIFYTLIAIIMGWINRTMQFFTMIFNPNRDLIAMETLRDTFALYNNNPHPELCSIELRFPQINKQFHIDDVHYARLVDVLFESRSRQVNPLDRSEISLLGGAVFDSSFLRKYYKDQIPQLSDDLRLYFSTDSVADGNWIQFHGPGTTLAASDPRFDVYLGSFCHPDYEGEFTSAHYNSTPGGRVERQTAKWTVSIKWETSESDLAKNLHW